MKRYERYKPSGVEWIGEIPEHWDARPTKYVLKPSKDGIRIGPFGSSLKSEFLSPSGYKIYGQENVINNDFSLGWRYINEDKFSELSEYEIMPGDVLVTMMGTTGKCKVVPQAIDKGIMDSHLIRMRIDETQVQPQLLADLVNDSSYVFNQVKMASKGSIMEGLNSSIIKEILLIVPPLDEQTAIANYLNRKTAQIDDLIVKKQRLMDLLNEEKAAIINHAVTKGLNPDVPMKDSGIRWLGQIPAHWEVKKLKYVCSLLKDGTHLPPPRVASGYPLLSVRNLVDGKDIQFLDDDSMISDDDFRELEKAFAVKENDVLLAIVGATMGKVSLVPKMEPFAIQRSLAIFRTKESLLNHIYLYYFFQSNYFWALLWNNTGFSAQPGIYLGALSNFSVVCPPTISEQLQIGEAIKTKIHDVETAVSRIDKETELLQEYRTALINEAVTGKIDVRGTN